MSVSVLDARFMSAALRFSRWHTGLTATNPSVACLIVKNDIIVGRGVTACGGRPHAETLALEEAKEKSQGATAYVTLEPCSHYGQVPPCAKYIVESGVKRVVVCVDDPDLRVSGEGLQWLLQNGIIVDRIMEREGKILLDPYLTRQVKNRPHVTLKIAVSQDNMIGMIGCGSIPITGFISRNQVHLLRAQSDAILVGIGTVLSDNPQLTCRLNGLNDRSPVRVILDPHFKLSLDSQIIKTRSLAPVIIVTENHDPVLALSFKKKNIDIIYCDCHHLERLLAILVDRGITSLLVEGGAMVSRSFVNAQLVDSIFIYRSKKVIGKGGISFPLEEEYLEKNFICVRRDYFGSDVCCEYVRKNLCLRES
ncbi:bifunctional diaminohydroxyphosphoribosylaminopyrimidine deaminase/5-amino-6-(5-phosphoribosylamino)uracil reductase RibD [Candidatus Liberibacter africanus]|uniref:Riboflavin biosynthesis protein RibD n=1 Tax=Candidatus Liberibacter africanus PTSAPSY TaxID=1277257 RepID=A0A0G3I649_LIBAF|nr:bifunctional diaminohydroxyphosphoribosylaminopyrimidine deaminase/5-amino-6-(5-phosphoribosylamino)uracil reductase RibD [Candidatus Liberibacter africanus]AKK19913.1 5-amino-6-(5-phosphoribosylamino)uracil reductase [Candidatus Liberibacter africanus PTSAPSY]QTP63759.1 bifunctional diaminohydroxyphosphoribosylaminopyrimidine deaminase/5-amino-6-(5-phosphoribosylamino)uracil reductase RibD [Candidatus Liberibacter africanus]